MNISQIKEVNFLVLPKKIIEAMRAHAKRKILKDNVDELWSNEDILYGLARSLEYYSHLALDEICTATVLKEFYKRIDNLIRFNHSASSKITFFCRFQDLHYARTIQVRNRVPFLTRVLAKKKVKYPITLEDLKENIYKYLDLTSRKLKNPFLYIQPLDIKQQELLRTLCTMLGEKIMSVAHPILIGDLMHGLNEFVSTPKGLEVMDIIYGLELEDGDKLIHLNTARGLKGKLTQFNPRDKIYLDLALSLQESFNSAILPMEILDEVE